MFGEHPLEPAVGTAIGRDEAGGALGEPIGGPHVGDVDSRASAA